MISELMSISRGCSGCLRAKASRCWVSSAPRAGGLVDHLRDRRKLRLLGDRLAEDLDRAGDDGEDVVEVVRHAAGELADRLHLLGMADAFLGGDLVGEVAVEHVEQDGPRGGAAP